jgi:hypothetical protein
MSGAIVQHGEGVPDDRIPQAGKPARLVRRHSIEIAPDNLDEQHLAQPQKYTPRARPWLARLGKRELDKRPQAIMSGGESR